MLRARRAWAWAVLAVLLSAGCATPTALDMQRVEEGQVEVAELLKAFAEAVRLKRSALIRPLLPPAMEGEEIREKQAAVEMAALMQLYKGYTLDPERGLAGVHWTDWRDGLFRVRIPGSNGFGDRLEDEFEVAEIGNAWYIRDFGLEPLEPGHLLDAPPEWQEEVRPTVAYIIRCLKEGRAAELDSFLPRHARARMPQMTFFERTIAEAPPRPLPLYEDFKLVREFHVPWWPDPDDPLPMMYLAPGVVVVYYDVPYTWPEGGVTERDELRIEITFREEEEGWEFYLLGLFGLGIPGT